MAAQLDIQQLLSPAAYDHAVDDVELHETHISWVLLAGDYAYKLKKAVDLGFVDFSTLEKRRQDCVDEVQLNRRLAPDMYLGVVDVVERNGRLHFGGAGETVEPAVRMRRLPAEGMLPDLLAANAVDARLVRRIARKVAAFHVEAATGSGVDEYGGIANIRANWDENFAQTREMRCIDPAAYATVRAYVQRFLQEQAGLLARRVETGRIRDGHGDLHAASICVEGSRIQLFDCIEFATRLRCADVASEVAFLAMDLTHRGRTDLARAFVDAYVRASADRELLSLLDFYACYRAYVRGKVLGMRLEQSSLPAAQAEAVAAQAWAYFELARTYAEGPHAPALVVCMGLPASGKSTVARELAARLALVYVSSDLVRKELAGLPLTDGGPRGFRAGIYTPGMTRRTYATLHRRAGRWLREGASVVLDATYGAAAERARLLPVAARAEAPLLVVECVADETVIVQRLEARAHGAEAGGSDARLELWPQLKQGYAEPAELEGVVRIDTGAGDVAHAVTAAVEAVRGLSTT